MITKRRLNKIVNDLTIISLVIETVNGLEGFDMEQYPYPIQKAEYEEIEIKCLVAFFIKVTSYILAYAIKHEVYEVCPQLEKIKALLIANI